jgi:hypothetical protein
MPEGAVEDRVEPAIDSSAERLHHCSGIWSWAGRRTHGCRRRRRRSLGGGCGDIGAAVRERDSVARRERERPSGRNALRKSYRFSIIKRLKAGYREHFLRERAGLSLLSEVVGERIAPKLLHENEAATALVLEDVGDSRSLDSLVGSSDPLAARKALVSVASRLGTLHARARSFGPRLHALPPVPDPGEVLTNSIAHVLRSLNLS